ncbi:MAG: EVE domain-containing protein [Snowella sp.]|nr:EVE domain-containing protein [Snowella sp.]
MNYWLMKSEPTTYSIETLESEGETLWDGVRNYQARNFLKQMQIGDRAFFYHSNTAIPGIVGLAEIVASQVIDPSQFDPHSDYYDPKSSPDAPRWHTVKVAFTQKFSRIITLTELKARFSPEELGVVKKGNRLSVLPIPTAIAAQILSLVSLGVPANET